MDPNHWNTYNIQYSSGSGGLAPSHPSLNRLDLSSGLSLGHTLQATHGSLSGRSMSAVSGVNYPGLGVPLLDSMSPLASGISGQAGPKTLSLAQSQLVYEPQVRGNPDHPSSNVNRYEGSSSSSKAFRPEALSPRDAAMARNQILEAAAARVWGSTNFPASSLYNQFGSIVSEVPASTDPVVSSPSAGNHMTSQKSNEPSLHNPPPAHSSGIPRQSAVQRMPSHPSEPPYIRSGDTLVPSSMALHVNTLYSPTIEKDTLSSNQLSSSLHRQTPVHMQHGYSSSREDIEDLSSNSQNTLYGSYANLAGTDTQDFPSGHMSADMNYEAVSPAPPINNEVAQTHPENASFQMAHFSEFTNLASDHPENLSDKFQENDIRLKMDARLQHDALSFSQVPHEGQDLSCLPKVSKDLANFVQSMQTHYRTSMIQQSSPINQALDIPHVVQTASANISHPASLLQPLSLTSPSSLQQNQVKPPVQALADSTTKPKRRSRKKKDGNVTIPATISDVKKSSISQDSLDSIQRQQISQHSPQLLSMAPSSQISTLPHTPILSQSSQIQQQSGYGISGANQFSGRESHRAQTPSVPQNYSSQEHQSYPPSPSPKVSLQSNQTVMRQPDFTLPSRNSSGKAGSYKQGQRKSKQVALPDVSINQNSHMYSGAIPESPLNMQNYPVHNSLLSQGSQGDSSMHDIHSGQHISRLPAYTPDQPQQGSIASQFSRLSQQSPQGSIPLDSPSYSHNKINGSNQYNIGSSVLSSIQQTSTDNSNMPSTHPSSHSSLEPSPVSVESTPISHTFDSARNPSMVEEQDTGQFQMDFGGQPFLEQLAGVPIPSNSYSHHSTTGNGEAVFTSLDAPPESASVHHHQQQQQPSQLNSSETFRPSYEEPVQEVRPVATLTTGLNMGDDVAFNPFFETQQGLDPQTANPGNQQIQSLSTPAEADPMTLTFVPQVGEDDDFSHFSDEPSVDVKKEHLNVRGKSESFQESFLSYLQGNKQETLSSVSSATITKRPQLPKYIPEPRRPRPQPPPPPPLASVPKESILVSDDENSGGSDSKVKDRLLNEQESATQKNESVKDGYSVQRTSELAVKITLPKGKKKNAFGESALLSHNRKMKESHSKFKKRKGKNRDSEGEDFIPEDVNDQDTHSPQTQGRRTPSPQPMRVSIGRKAKEKVMEKSRKRRGYTGSGSSTEEEIGVQFLSNRKFNSNDSDQDYDSDKDPVWMPFSVDLKQGHDYDEKRKKTRKTRSRAPASRSGRQPAAKVPHTNPVVSITKEKVMSLQRSDVSTSSTPRQDPAQSRTSSDSPTYGAGQYLIEKKDLQSYESYPVWRLEDNGSMIHKYELVIDGGVVKHKAVGTYSTWMKSMHNQFQPIKVKELTVKGREAVLVQVLEEFRPKPPCDGKLIMQYEDDPLVEPFNVYLQVFLSQALEPSFLKTIIDRKETFYMEALDKIDKSLQTKLDELAIKARWTIVFKEALHKYSLMKEIDRPSLKQACQACENSSPPTIKSVVLSGHAYDRVLLTELSTAHSDAQEYMIGKTAAYYVRTYHTLCHYKYWLHRRCQSKVKLIKESSKAENPSDEMILDRCLENRNWVLQLFDDLKKLLTFGGDVPR